MTIVQLRAQDYKPSPELEALHVPFDALLDLHVRDGLVYYRALQGDRDRLNRYIASLNAAGDCGGVRSNGRPTEEGVLDQRLQRARAADRRQQLPDSRAGVERIPPTASGRFQAPSRRRRTRRGQERDARSDREHGARRVQRSARVYLRLGAAPSAAAGCGAKRSAPRP